MASTVPVCRYVLRAFDWSDNIGHLWLQMYKDMVDTHDAASSHHMYMWITATSMDHVQAIQRQIDRWPACKSTLDRRLLITLPESNRKVHPLYQDEGSTIEAGLVELWRRWKEQRLPSVDYVWLIHGGVRCKGSWKTTLQAALSVSTQTVDYAATCIEPYDVERNGQWYYWHANMGRAKESYTVPPLTQRWKSFQPVCRLSRQWMMALDQHVGEWTDASEVFLPTFTVQHGMTLQNMNADVLCDVYRHDRDLTEAEWQAHAKTLPQTHVLAHPIHLYH